MAYLMEGFQFSNPIESFKGGFGLGDAIRKAQYTKQLRTAIDQDQSLTPQEKAYLRANPDEFGTYTQNKQRLSVGGIGADRLKLRGDAAAAVPVANEAARRYRSAAIDLDAAMQSGDTAAIESSKADLESAMQDYNEAIKTVATVEGMSSYVTGRLDSAEEIAADRALMDANLKLKQLSAEFKPEEIEIEKQKADAAQKQANANLSMSSIQREKAAADVEYGTEGERNALGFYKMTQEAEPSIKPISKSELSKIRGTGFETLDNVRAVENFSPEFQSAYQWGTNALRKESGAAIGDREMDTFIKTYIPVEGDSQETLDRKSKARAAKSETLLISAGRLAKREKKQSPTGVKEGNIAKPKTKAEYEALPAGAKYIAQDGSTRVKGGK